MSAAGAIGRFDHAVLFTGHMIDAPGRKAERFPARAEAAAREAIGQSLEALAAAHSAETFVGIAGGASGGDLLFHELCLERQVPTLLRLALPLDRYIEASVAPAGSGWVRRFHALIEHLGPEAVRVMDDSVIVSAALTGGAKLNIWQRTNLWMAEEAIALAPQRTLIALWDGSAGDGPGGTADLVGKASEIGIELAPLIRTQTLFERTRTAL